MPSIARQSVDEQIVKSGGFRGRSDGLLTWDHEMVDRVEVADERRITVRAADEQQGSRRTRWCRRCRRRSLGQTDVSTRSTTTPRTKRSAIWHAESKEPANSGVGDLDSAD
jgi:hypothetical protein